MVPFYTSHDWINKTSVQIVVHRARILSGAPFTRRRLCPFTFYIENKSCLYLGSIDDRHRFPCSGELKSSQHVVPILPVSRSDLASRRRHLFHDVYRMHVLNSSVHQTPYYLRIRRNAYFLGQHEKSRFCRLSNRLEPHLLLIKLNSSIVTQGTYFCNVTNTHIFYMLSGITLLTRSHTSKIVNGSVRIIRYTLHFVRHSLSIASAIHQTHHCHLIGCQCSSLI